MTDFTTWYTALPMLLQVFWACAAVASLVFLVQMVLTLLGMDTTSADMDAPDLGGVDGDTLGSAGSIGLFSLRNLINFLLGFGWGGVCLHDSIPSTALLLLAAIAVGALFVWMFFSLYKQLRRFEANGAFRIERCLGHTATVYLRIPADGCGKVQISVGGATQEINALSDTPLTTGTLVRVTEIIDQHTLRVEPI